MAYNQSIYKNILTDEAIRPYIFAESLDQSNLNKSLRKVSQSSLRQLGWIGNLYLINQLQNKI